MMKLSKKVQYALVAMFHLDRVAPGTRVTTHDLSQLYDVPEQHLGKILQRLGKAGLLRSVQGVQGGYELHRSLREMTLGEVLEAVEGQSAPVARKDHTILTLFPACYVQGLAREVERTMIDRVHAMRLSEVLQQVNVPENDCIPLEVAG
jgi:Rrf2 family protein